MYEKIVAAIKALFAAKGLDYDSNKEAIETEIKKVVEAGGSEIDLSKLDLSKFSNNDNGKLLQAVIDRTNSLDKQIKDMFELVKADADAKKSDKEKADAAAAAKLETDIKKAVDYVILTKKAFPESQREQLTELAKANLESFTKVYGEAQPGKEFIDKPNPENNNEPAVVRSTSGNAIALKAIKEHQAAIS